MTQKYDIRNLQNSIVNGNRMVQITRNDNGIKYVYDYERVYDILTCQLDTIIVPTQNFQLMNKYIEQGYVIIQITQLVTRMISKRKLYWQNEKSQKEFEKK